LDHTRGDELVVAGGERAGGGAEREDREADKEYPFASEAVAELSTEQDEPDLDRVHRRRLALDTSSGITASGHFG
jgi:hypothetical protein